MQDAMNRQSAYRTAPAATGDLPDGIPYIIGNEAAERFSFYGMKGILVIFMSQYLYLMGPEAGVQMSRAAATERYHLFTGLVYFTPIFGALLSDLWLGKYRTILYLSVVYCLGHFSLALMGSPGLSPSLYLLAGLGLIALGSGGIKPCVSAHVGDQFGLSNRHLLSRVFGWFYFSINTGAFLSTLATPWLLQWYGPHWAFGVPGVLMALATWLFWLGRKTFIHVPPGGLRFWKETFSPEGLSCLLKLSVVYVFVAMFWALFDQTGSTWVLQAEDLDRNFLGINWLPSQIQAVNPILILLLIPVFSYVIYPAFQAFFPLSPMRKISLGLFVMIGGFAIVAWLQALIDRGERPSIGWQFLAYGVLTSSEIMVSITALEFSYTQAPRSMKSVVMALFLMSVALGNFFTTGVNNLIQVPSQLSVIQQAHDDWWAKREELDTAQRTARVAAFKDSYGTPLKLIDQPAPRYQSAGADGSFDTDDDVFVTYNAEGGREAVETPFDSRLNEAAELIEQSFKANQEALPFTEDGAALLAELNAGRTEEAKIAYHLVSRNQYQLVHPGIDGALRTSDDARLIGEVSRAEASEDDEQAPVYTWKETRLIKLKGEAGRQEVERSRGQVSQTEISRSVEVGGGLLLKGAAYFWFWTIVMAATAASFVVVAILYRPKEYLQEEADQ